MLCIDIKLWLQFDVICYFSFLIISSLFLFSSRTILHDEIQEYLRARYYLSPSRLYSVARLLPNRQGYDVPVDGDWVTIAVVAERGPVKFSKAPVALKTEDDVFGGDSDDERDAGKAPSRINGAGYGGNRMEEWKKRKRDDASSATKDGGTKTRGKKYVHMKLIDFGSRGSASSRMGDKAVIRGDAFLSLMLFEADSFSKEMDVDGKETKMYRGGSKGAFEFMSRVKEGDVIALLNPRILKPFQVSGFSFLALIIG
jgi:minichromosome maintenance protein 10